MSWKITFCQFPILSVYDILSLSNSSALREMYFKDTLMLKTKLSSHILIFLIMDIYLFVSPQRAVITHMSPDALYLFRVQALCQRDQRSDFSQTLLFKGKNNYKAYIA